MTVGFVMLAHAALGRAGEVAVHLSKNGCPVAVHVDRRVPEAAFQGLKRQVADHKNIKFQPRIACEWGAWSLVDASRRAAADLLKSHKALTHVYLISGACLPIKPVPDLMAFLESNRDTDFIESVTIDDVTWTQGGLSDERFSLYFPFSWRRQRRLFDISVEVQRRLKVKRRLPHGLLPHMGSQWWCLSRTTLEKVLFDPRRPELDAFFKKVWIPDESYFQSLVRLYGAKVESRSLTLSKFDTNGRPYQLFDDHLPMLHQSTAFCARKIWPGATELYDLFLNAKRPETPMISVSSANIERNFDEAGKRRKFGRSGLVMSGRFPEEETDLCMSASPYTIFHGFDDVFEGFADWAERHTKSNVHGHLFAPETAEFQGSTAGFFGGLSSETELRDYDAPSFLRALIWNTRGAHQSFLFSAHDNQSIVNHIANDRKALIFAVTGAWAVRFLKSTSSAKDIRAEAAVLQKREAEFVECLNAKDAQARSHIWSLAELLRYPQGVLQEIADVSQSSTTGPLIELPQMALLEGLPEFLQSLKNKGMNPYLAGDLAEQVQNQPGRVSAR